MTTIKLKNGSGAPAGGDLVQGEPALDLTNKRLYTENASGTVIEVGTNPGVDVTFADNRKAIFGASSDLQIYHDGSNSYVQDTGDGDLILQGTNVQLRSNNTMRVLQGVQGAETKIFYNNAQKLATTSTGIDVTGTAVTDGITSDGVATVKVNSDGATAEVFNVYNTGSGNNTQARVYFGASAYSTAGRGLRIDAGRDSGADGIATFYSVDQAEHSDYEAIKILTDGGVTLSHLGSNKLATTSTGIDVTGTAVTDGLTVDTAIATSTASFRSTTNSTTIGQKIGSLDFFNGTTNAAGTLEVRRASGGNAYSDVALMASANGNRSNQLLLSTNGDISFYEDTGTTAKFFWDASAESLGIGTSSPSSKLHVANAATEEYIFETTNNNTRSQVEIKSKDSSGNAVQTRIGSIGDGVYGMLYTFTNHNLSFATNNAAPQMTLDTSGNVGIGVAPSSPLHVNVGTNQNLEIDSAGSELRLSAVNDARSTNPAIRFQAESYKFYGAGGVGPRATIDSSGNVGIGTSPTNLSNYKVLHVQSGHASAGGRIRLQTNTASEYADIFNFNDSLYKDANTQIFRNNDGSTEYMRIDSSGNLLVGKTSADDFSSAGAQIEAGGQFTNSVASAPSLRLNRGGNDGDIIELNKAGTTVGSIGVDNSDNLYISGGSGHGGVEFGSNAVIPSSNGVAADATVKLGNANYRYTDLYLSGGVYLGGTGSANKLDDYEEGTWTPVVSDGTNDATASTAEGTYTKVGRQVTLSGRFILSSLGSVSGSTRITGLPFAVSSGNAGRGSLSVSYAASFSLSAGFTIIGSPASGASHIFLGVWDIASGTTDLQASEMTATSTLFFSATYFV